MSSEVRSYRDLIVWQKGMELAAEAYRLSDLLPRAEAFRLANQLVKATASVPANIAEGHARGTRRDYANFISIARGSLAETETFLQLAIKVEMLEPGRCDKALGLCDELSRMLATLWRRLRSPQESDPA